MDSGSTCLPRKDSGIDELSAGSFSVGAPTTRVSFGVRPFAFARVAFLTGVLAAIDFVGDDVGTSASTAELDGTRNAIARSAAATTPTSATRGPLLRPERYGSIFDHRIAGMVLARRPFGGRWIPVNSRDALRGLKEGAADRGALGIVVAPAAAYSMARCASRIELKRSSGDLARQRRIGPSSAGATP